MSMLNIPTPMSLPEGVASGADLKKQLRAYAVRDKLPRAAGPAATTKRGPGPHGKSGRTAPGKLRIFNDAVDINSGGGRPDGASLLGNSAQVNRSGSIAEGASLQMPAQQAVVGGAGALAVVPSVLDTREGGGAHANTQLTASSSTATMATPPLLTGRLRNEPRAGWSASTTRSSSRARSGAGGDLPPALSSSMNNAMAAHVRYLESNSGIASGVGLTGATADALAAPISARSGLETWPSPSGGRGAFTPSLGKAGGSGMLRDDGMSRPKPALLKRLETLLADELAVAYNDDAKLRVYQEVFHTFIEGFGAYAPLLSQVKAAYDDRVSYCAQVRDYVTSLESQLSTLRDEEFARIEDIEIESAKTKRQANQRVLEVNRKYEDLWMEHKEHSKNMSRLEGKLADLEKRCATLASEKKRFASAVEQQCDVNNSLKSRLQELEEAYNTQSDIASLKETVLITELEKAGRKEAIEQYRQTHWGTAIISKREDAGKRPSTPPNLGRDVRNMSAVVNFEVAGYADIVVAGEHKSTANTPQSSRARKKKRTSAVVFDP